MGGTPSIKIRTTCLFVKAMLEGMAPKRLFFAMLGKGFEPAKAGIGTLSCHYHSIIFDDHISTLSLKAMSHLKISQGGRTSPSSRCRLAIVLCSHSTCKYNIISKTISHDCMLAGPKSPATGSEMKAPSLMGPAFGCRHDNPKYVHVIATMAVAINCCQRKGRHSQTCNTQSCSNHRHTSNL